jgi:uncharacterized protein (TIGR03437 family)
MWNSTGLAAGYVSSTSLTASVPANLLTAPTIASISVVNPAGACPPGGTSPAVNFVVAAISSPPNLAIIVQPSLVQPVAPAQSTTPLFNTVNVRNVDGSTLTTPLATSVFTVSGGNWLATIPQTSDDLQQGVVRFTTDPTGLAQGSYLGYILYPSLGGTTGSASGKLRPFAAPSCNQVSTAVIFTAGSPALTFSPSYPALTAGAGGAAAISIDVTVNQITQGYSPPIPIRVAATSNEGAGAPCWLSISPLDTPLQTDMRFQATASSTNLNPGVHHGFLTAQGGGTTASDVIFFTNTASGTPVLDAGNDLITIDSATGMGAAHLDSTPTSLPFTATCNGCAGTTLTAACSGCQSVAAGQVNGMTPADLTVTLDPASLSLFVSGQASVAISSSGAANLTIPVTKAPASLPNGPQIFPGGIVSAGLSVPRIQTASLNAILSIFGQNFASAGTSRMVATGDLVDGLLPTNLGGVCVLFGDQRAPIFLVTPGQLNVQAPELPGSDNVPVQVLTNCDAANQVASASVMLAVQAAAPEFFYFAITPGGNNPIAATDGVTNAPIGDPSRLGTGFTLGYPDEVVVIYATGLGLTTPPFAPGQLPSSSAPVTGVTVAIDSAPVDPTLIQYAGVTPGLAGLYQLNLELPAELAPGDHTITISVNGISSPAGPYISTGPPPM